MSEQKVKASKFQLPKAAIRLASEVKEACKNPNIHVDIVNENLTHLKALVIGPDDTPFQGGFFIFDIYPRENFPMDPHVVYHQTTQSRIHPNLYAAPNGKVCLSILGTWGQYEWSPLYSLQAVLVTIQGLIDNNPITNEPGHEKTKESSKDAKDYALATRMIKLRDCVIESMGRKDISDEMKDKMNKYFVKNQDKYVEEVLALPSEEVAYFHGGIKVKKNVLLAKFMKE